MIFLLLGSRFFTNRIQLFQPVNVLLRNCGRCHCAADRIIEARLCVGKRLVHVTRSFCQFLYGRSRTVFGCISHCHDSASQRGHGGHTQHDRPGHSTECCGNVQRFNDFGDCGVCRQCDRCTADYARECCNALDERRILLHKLAEDVQHIRTGVVSIAQRRGKSIAYGNLEVVVGVLHHVQLGLRGGVSLVGFVRQSDILIPRGICGLDGAVHLVSGQREGLEHIALANAGKTEVLQHEYGAFALLVQTAKSADKRRQSAQSVRIPHFCERIRRHSRDICEAL